MRRWKDERRIQGSAAGWLAAHWQEDRGQCLGLLAGIVLAIMILLIGFWRTAFIVLCGGAGLYIGRKADREPDFFGRIADEFLDRINRLR